MPNLIVERSNGVVRLTLNRPERLNAVTVDMWTELTEVFAEVAARDDDRVLVITGAGKGFCSGADLAAERSTATHEQLKLMRARGPVRSRAARHPQADDRGSERRRGRRRVQPRAWRATS